LTCTWAHCKIGSLQCQAAMLRITATLALARAFASRPRKLRAIALDLDGTLCNSKGVVTDATAAALAKFAIRGTVIIATGRGKAHAEIVATTLQQRGARVEALVCSDGAVAYARTSDDAFDELVFECVALGGVVAEALGQITSAVPGGVSFAAEINAASGVAISSQTYLDTIERCNPYFFERMLAGKTPVDDFFATVAAAERVNWVRCVGTGEDDGSGKLLAAVRAVTPEGLRCEPSTIQLPGGPESVVVKPDTSKAKGLDAVVASRGIKPEEVCAFGDAENDHEMLSWAGAAVVPSNAREGAKARATFVSGLSNDEDFVADALGRSFAELASASSRDKTT